MSTTLQRRGALRRGVAGSLLRILIPFDAIALLFAGIVHLVGVSIPLGAMAFVEPAIVPAGVVETLAGLFFVWATATLWSGRGSAWMSALVAHLVAIAGFLLGLYSTRNGTTPFNHVYHWVMLALFVIGLIALLLPSTRWRAN
jgi:hypothetical protein